MFSNEKELSNSNVQAVSNCLSSSTFTVKNDNNVTTLPLLRRPRPPDCSHVPHVSLDCSLKSRKIIRPAPFSKTDPVLDSISIILPKRDILACTEPPISATSTYRMVPKPTPDDNYYQMPTREISSLVGSYVLSRRISTKPLAAAELPTTICSGVRRATADMIAINTIDDQQKLICNDLNQKEQQQEHPFLNQPRFTLQDFILTISEKDKLPAEAVATTMYSRQNYDKMQQMLMKQLFQSKQDEIHTVQLQLPKELEVRRRIPYRQHLIELTAQLQNEINELLSTKFSSRNLSRIPTWQQSCSQLAVRSSELSEIALHVNHEDTDEEKSSRQSHYLPRIGNHEEIASVLEQESLQQLQHLHVDMEMTDLQKHMNSRQSQHLQLYIDRDVMNLQKHTNSRQSQHLQNSMDAEIRAMEQENQWHLQYLQPFADTRAASFLERKNSRNSHHRQHVINTEVAVKNSVVCASRTKFFQGSQRSASPFRQGNLDLISLAEAAVLEALMNGGSALNLKALFISTTPGIYSLKSTLVYLNISYNSFRTLPVEICDMDHLKVIKARNNPLESIPSKISKLQNLRTLVLSFCLIEELPPELFQLKKLEVLDLAYNKLSDVPSLIERLKSLEELMIEGNQLSGLPVGVLCLPRLHYLRLMNNFMHPLFWSETSRNGPQKLRDLACLAVHDFWQGVPIPEYAVEAMKGSMQCDCCDGRRFGHGLHTIRPARVCGIANVPIIFRCCSASCLKNFVNKKEGLDRLLRETNEK